MELTFHTAARYGVLVVGAQAFAAADHFTSANIVNIRDK
jgi:hypothetical protein